MNFIKKILNTKKAKEAKKVMEDISDSISDSVTSFAKKTDDKFNISEKFDDAKESISDVVDDTKKSANNLDDKFNISEKFDDAKESISDAIENVGDKIESLLDDKISFDTFAKSEIKIGEVIDAKKVEKSDKLLNLTVDFGEENTRQIISGIAKSYSIKKIKGKKAVFVTNLEPRKIMGLESDGMILGVSNGNNFSILSPEKDDIKIGTRAS